MNSFQALLIAAALAIPVQVIAQTTAPMAPMAPMTTMAPADGMTAGAIVKVNTEQQKVTVKHEAIKNLDMPGMTMVFRVKDPAMLTSVKAGDSIQFHAEKIDGAITITHMQASK